MTSQESTPTPLSAEQNRRARLNAGQRNDKRLKELSEEAAANSALSPDTTVIDSRKVNRDEIGIHITANEFVVDPLTDEQKASLAEYEAAEAAKIEARLEANPTNSTEPDEESSTSKKSEKDVKTARQKTSTEKEPSKEKKERVKPEKNWFKRIGEAAITNFLTLRKVGIVDFVTDKVDTARENIASKFETFTGSLSERHAKARKNLEELSGKSDEAVKKLLTNRAEALKRRAARLEKYLANRETNKTTRRETRANRFKPFEQAADKNAEDIARRAATRRLGKRGIDNLTTAA
jgi:hypothetical protein